MTGRVGGHIRQPSGKSAALLALASCATTADRARARALGAAVDPARPFPESSFVQSGGLSLHYRQWLPSGEPVGRILLLHGFGSSTFSFRYLVPELLAAGWDVAAADIPPFGHSDKSDAIARMGYDRGSLLWAVPDDMVDGYATPFLAPGGARALLDWSKASARQAPVYPQVLKAPTLLVWGEKDSVVPLKEGRKLAAAIPGSRLVVLPGLGHLAHELQPGQVDPAIIEFLREISLY